MLHCAFHKHKVDLHEGGERKKLYPEYKNFKNKNSVSNLPENVELMKTRTTLDRSSRPSVECPRSSSRPRASLSEPADILTSRVRFSYCPIT